ncbi:MAG: hypothetical protein ACRD88_22530 [Terriglobia bacterium]
MAVRLDGAVYEVVCEIGVNSVALRFDAPEIESHLSDEDLPIVRWMSAMRQEAKKLLGIR